MGGLPGVAWALGPTREPVPLSGMLANAVTATWSRHGQLAPRGLTLQARRFLDPLTATLQTEKRIKPLTQGGAVWRQQSAPLSSLTGEGPIG
ncbi:hypothetical protein B5P44_05345 [Mycobacterium sp. CBMA 213]|nr:hypothetical protein [Mycolicibacterium sp. CBMA 213]